MADTLDLCAPCSQGSLAVCAETTGVLVTNYYRGASSPSSRATSFAELCKIRT